jgi:2-polyprenyl-3-methyl-5-hydroxy-6-metoxy-1,4-benzoquinol methylase
VSVRQHRALDIFSGLPLKERLFVRARLFSAPLAALAARCPAGRILDIGCGHGALIALLAGEPGRTVLGIDPDPRKIAWAQAGPGQLANVSLRQATVDDLLPDLEGHFDAVAVADVLYLLPTEDWADFADSCRRLLKPGGLLLLKEAEANRSWKHFKCLAQEQLMVRLLRRTHGSGGLTLQPRRFTEQLLADRGFAVEEVVDLSAGYTTPHVLYVARAEMAPRRASSRYEASRMPR